MPFQAEIVSSNSEPVPFVSERTRSNFLRANLFTLLSPYYLEQMKRRTLRWAFTAERAWKESGADKEAAQTIAIKRIAKTEISLFCFHHALVSSNYQFKSPALILSAPFVETKTALNQTKSRPQWIFVKSTRTSEGIIMCDLLNMELIFSAAPFKMQRK